MRKQENPSVFKPPTGTDPRGIGPLFPLFVYGTLKRGFCNHHFLSGRNTIFLGRARTEENLALFVGRFPYVTARKRICPISGELYLVDRNTLSRVDCLEEHPFWYKRSLTKVVLKDGTVWHAYLYFNDHPEGRLIKNGLYLRGVPYS